MSGGEHQLRPKFVGASVKRVEDPRLLSGRGAFTDDLQPARMLHAAVLRSSHPHAALGPIDTARAASSPGVVAVLTGADIAGEARAIRATSTMKDYHVTPMPLLARDRVRYVGEPVAVVVASSRYLAEDALRLIEVDYHPLPLESDPERAQAEDAPLLHEAVGSNVILERSFSRGEPEAAMAVAPVRLRGRFRFRRKTPLAIENRSYLAEYDAGRGILTLHGATQVPGVVRDAIAELLELPGHAVRVVAADVGGGFGGKASVYPEELLTALLARRLERPVNLTCDRLEDLTATSQAFDEVIEAELGLDAEGKIVALTAEVTGDVGAYSIYPWTAALEPVQVVSFLPGPYRQPAYRGSVKGVVTPKAPMGPYRGVGRPVSTFVLERLLDRAAARLEVDPVELRLRNLVREEEFPYRTGSGIVWDGADFVGCLEAARDALGYRARRAWQREARAAGRWVGIGFASYAELTGIGSKISAAPGMPVNTGTETATVRVDPAGTVTAIFGVASHGQGLETTLAQVVADELGVALGDVRILQGDTAGRAYTTGTYASRSAVLAGGAAKLAAGATREKILRVAAHLLDAEPEALALEDSLIFVPETNRRVSLRDVAQAAYVRFGQLPPELQDELEATRLYDPVFGTASAATHAVVVEVDPELYQVSILDYVVAEDCGRVINPMIVDGQVHGGVAQGIGAALYEEVVYDAEGQLLTGSLMDYLVPTAAEIPGMRVFHVESASPTTLGGFRGMGEGGTIGAPAAIANAVSDAIGFSVDELPVTPERIFRLVQAGSD